MAHVVHQVICTANRFWPVVHLIHETIGDIIIGTVVVVGRIEGADVVEYVVIVRVVVQSRVANVAMHIVVVAAAHHSS